MIKRLPSRQNSLRLFTSFSPADDWLASRRRMTKWRETVIAIEGIQQNPDATPEEKKWAEGAIAKLTAGKVERKAPPKGQKQAE